MKKDNILFITHGMCNGGAERIMSYLINGFPESDNKYLVVDNRNDKEYECNCNILSLGLYKKDGIHYKIINNLKRYFKLRSIKKKLCIDKSISLLDNPNIMNILTKNNEKVIISIRNCKSEEEKGISNLYKKFIKYIYSKSDRIISISEGVKLDLINNYGIDSDKIQVIYNPIDTKNIDLKKNSEIEQEYKCIFKNPVVINAGRLTEQKGQWHLIKSFSKVVEEIPNAKLVILGDGELKADLEKLISNLKLENSVFLLGFKENLFKYIRNSEVFVLSSLYEGFGNVILEAMACGTPVISTDCKYGPREIINPNSNIDQNISEIEYGEYGVLTPRLNRDIDFSFNRLDNEELQLADIIIDNLSENSKLEIYRKKIDSRVEDFGYENIVNQWIKL